MPTRRRSLSLLAAMMTVFVVPVAFAQDPFDWLVNQPGLVVQESQPVTVNGAQFSIVAEGRWTFSDDRLRRPVPVDIQLQIKNVGNGDLLLPTLDTFGLILVDPKGNRLNGRGGQDAVIVTRPILLKKGESYSIIRKAELLFDAQTGVNELWYWNGAGSVQAFGPLESGKYELGFNFHTHQAQHRAESAVGMIQKQTVPGATTWSGRITSERVSIAIQTKKRPEEKR